MRRLLVLLSLLVAASAGAADRPNIVLILADDLGYGDLGCYGQKQIPTPALDRLAGEGLRFTQFYAGAPVCAPSRNVLMTGQHTGHATIRGNAKVNLRPEDTTIAQVLQAAGYTTALFGKWGLGAEGSDATPRAKGFDEFFGYVDQSHAHNYYPAFLVHNDERVPLRNVVPSPGPFGQGSATERVDYSPDLILDAALAHLDRQTKAQPFFVFLSFTLPHANNEGRPHGSEVPDLGPFADRPWPDVEKGFAAMVARLDRDVGRVLAKLRERGLEENTLVLFTSDNGPHHEGGHDADFFQSRGGLRGYKRDLYEGGLRVPCLVRWPAHIPAGRTSDVPAWFADLAPTFAALAWTNPPPRGDGANLLPVFVGHVPPDLRERTFYWEFYEGASAQAVRLGPWKAVRRPLRTGPIELYDLTTDPGEQHDVAVAHPEVVARARAALEAAHVPSPLWTVAP